MKRYTAPVESDGSLAAWLRTLPRSKMIFPKRAIDRSKYIFWTFYTPIHLFVLNLGTRMGLIRLKPRGKYLLGQIDPRKGIREFISYCIGRGYANHFVAWCEEGEVASLRYVEDFIHQYHLRIFENGEVRGHYEYTPECYPLRHLRKLGLEDRDTVFREQLGDQLIWAHRETAAL